MNLRTKKRLRQLPLVASVLLLALWADCMLTGFTLGLFNHPRDRWGEAAMAVMREADTFEVIRLNKPPQLPRDFANLAYYGMVATGDPIKPKEEWTTRLREGVDNSWNYNWYMHARCLPEPGVCVRFSRGAEVVDLLLCFECSLVSLASPGQHGGPITEQWIDFRASRAPFAKLVKEMFPNDAAIQAIAK